jgi:hypothetical protein
MSISIKILSIIDTYKTNIWHKNKISYSLRLIMIVELMLIFFIYFSLYVVRNLKNALLEDHYDPCFTPFYKLILDKEKTCLICFNRKECYTRITCIKNHPCCKECLQQWNLNAFSHQMFKCIVCKK